MTNEQIKHQKEIVQVFRFMHIQLERCQGHADIVGDGAQIIGIDDTLARIDAQGVIAEETLSHLRTLLDTQEDMDVVRLYDAQGKAV